jgi:formylglycine-generating enzyme required for sulfatase activity
MAMAAWLSWGITRPVDGHAPSENRFHALVVGVSQCRTPSLGQREFAIKDSEDIARVLREKGYEVMCLNSNRGARDPKLIPTRRNIEEHLEWLVENRQRDDTLLLVMSGPGAELKLEKKGLVRTASIFFPADASIIRGKKGAETDQVMPVEAILKKLGSSGAGGKLLLMDSDRKWLHSTLSAIDVPEPRLPPGLAMIQSCAQGEMSHSSSKLQASIFTRMAVRGLQGEAATRDGIVTVLSFAEFVTDKCAQKATELALSQAPVAAMGEQGRIVLALKDSDRPVSPNDSTIRRLSKVVTNGLGMQLCLIRDSAGDFEMGSPEGEEGRKAAERLHPVRISRPYYMGATEVTQKQYRRVMGENPSAHKDNLDGDRPVEQVTYWEAARFCKKLGEMEGKRYRLPTEAEWEWACRAKSGGAYSFGNDAEQLDDYAVYDKNSAGTNGEHSPDPVGKKQPNKFGLYDMHGNVSEWVADWAADYPREAEVDPRGPADGKLKVHRGGSFENPARSLRSANRAAKSPDKADVRLASAWCWKPIEARRAHGRCSMSRQSQGLLACCLAMAAGLVVVASQSGGERRFHALVVGVSEYDSSNLVTLDFASKDAGDLEEVLRQRGYDVRCLNTDRGRRDARLIPNKRNIEEAVEWLARNRRRNETILLALSGHGVNMEVKESNRRFPFFCPSDASPDDKTVKLETGEHESMVNINNVMKRLAASGAEDKVILIDACRERVEARARNVDFEDVTVPKGLAVMYGCRQNQVSYEHVKFRNGYFTHWVLEGLRGKAAREEDGEIDFASLQSFVTRRMRNSHADIGKDQQPRTVQSETGLVTLAVNVGKDRPGRDDADRPSDRVITNSIGMKLARIPKGTFMMGSPETEAGHHISETLHEVTLTKDYYLGVYEVTQDEFRKVMGDNPSHFEGPPSRPVERVSWEDAVEFCKRLSDKPEEKKTGWKYRLPTEAEWEYACRAGSQTAYSFGDDARLLGDFAWFSDNSNRQTHAVGGKKPNGWGLYDMHGNVWEWCGDLYGDYPRGSVTDPTGPNVGSDRVLRGGCWGNVAARCRSALRLGGIPSFRGDDCGFRVALSSSGIPK